METLFEQLWSPKDPVELWAHSATQWSRVVDKPQVCSWGMNCSFAQSSPSSLRSVSRRSWHPGPCSPRAGWWRHHAGDCSQWGWDGGWHHTGLSGLKHSLLYIPTQDLLTPHDRLSWRLSALKLKCNDAEKHFIISNQWLQTCFFISVKSSINSDCQRTSGLF